MQVLLAPPRLHAITVVPPGGPIAPVTSRPLPLDGFEHLAGFQRDCERQARQALGEAAFQAACHRGLELPAADVLAYALQQPPAKPPKRPPAPAVPEGAPLSRRELQVARLIAAGRSNKEIAAELVISRRTAEGHVERILTKLGFTSRARVAAWVAASQPVDEGRLAAPRRPGARPLGSTDVHR